MLRRKIKTEITPKAILILVGVVSVVIATLGLLGTRTHEARTVVFAHPEGWTSIGPVSIGESRKKLHESIGAGKGCGATFECYTDGSAFVQVTFASDIVSEIVVSENKPPMDPAAYIKDGVPPIKQWLWYGQSVFSKTYVKPDPSWKLALQDGHSRGYIFGNYEVAQSSTKDAGWITAVYCLTPAGYH